MCFVITVIFFYPQVKENSYKAHQELQLHMKYAKKPNETRESIHLHLAHQKELKRQLASSESTLQKLGNFAALINQIITQSLVTIIQQDVTSFLSNVLKVTLVFNIKYFQIHCCKLLSS